MAVPPAASAPQFIAIAAANATTYQGLADLCGQAGQASVWFPPRQVPRATNVGCGLWDDSSGDFRGAAAFAQAIAPAPVIALLNFLRPHDSLALSQLGIDGTVGKPFLAVDLLEVVGRLTTTAMHRSRRHAA